VDEDAREVDGEMDALRIRITDKLAANSPIIVGIQDLNITGSNEEKMSGIMQDSGCPNVDFEGL